MHSWPSSLSGGAPPDAGEIAGKSNLQLYEALVARFGGPATAEELSQRHFRLVCQLLEEYRVGPMPGLEEALDALRRRGIPLWGGVLLLALVRGALPAGVGDV